MIIFLDGKYVTEDEAKISVFDHGLLYGDGVFEGIRVYGGKIFRLEQHLNRLNASAKAIMLQVPMTKQALTEACCETCRQNKITDGYIRLVVTRGVGYLGLNPFKCKSPTVFIIAATIELYPEEVYRKGLNLITAATQRVSPAAVSPSINGWLTQVTGSNTYSMYLVMAMYVLAGLVLLVTVQAAGTSGQRVANR